MHDRADQAVPFENGAAIAASWGGRLLETSGLSHGAMLRDPDVVSAVLGFGDRQASFTCSTQIEPDQRVHVVGTEGRLVVEIPFNIPPDRATRLLLTAGGDPPVAPNTEVIEIPAADQYGLQGDLFSRAVLDDAAVPTPPEDGVANMRVIDAIRAAGAKASA